MLTTPFNEERHNQYRKDNGTPYRRYMKDLKVINQSVSNLAINHREQ